MWCVTDLINRLSYLMYLQFLISEHKLFKKLPFYRCHLYKLVFTLPKIISEKLSLCVIVFYIKNQFCIGLPISINNCN